MRGRGWLYEELVYESQSRAFFQTLLAGYLQGVKLQLPLKACCTCKHVVYQYCTDTNTVYSYYQYYPEIYSVIERSFRSPTVGAMVAELWSPTCEHVIRESIIPMSHSA